MQKLVTEKVAPGRTLNFTNKYIIEPPGSKEEDKSQELPPSGVLFGFTAHDLLHRLFS